MNMRNNLEVLLTQDEVLKKISQIGKQLDKDYAGREIVIVMVMKGSICLVADLIRHIRLPCSLEFISSSSYGARGDKRGELTLSGLEGLPVTSKHVLVIDDIFDSGKTLASIVERLKEMQPETIKSLVLLNKKVDKRVHYRPDYVLFSIEDRFVVGYGLDFKEHYRGLPGIYALKGIS